MADRQTAAGSKKSASRLELTTSRQLTSWLAEHKVSLAFTTYQAGKLFLLGLQPDGRLSVFERNLERCMGLTAAGPSLYAASLYQLWRFENALEPGQSSAGYDHRVYVPQIGYVTGDLDVHDIALDGTDRIVFVNTLFGCLATVASATPSCRCGSRPSSAAWRQRTDAT